MAWPARDTKDTPQLSHPVSDYHKTLTSPSPGFWVTLCLWQFWKETQYFYVSANFEWAFIRYVLAQSHPEVQWLKAEWCTTNQFYYRLIDRSKSCVPVASHRHCDETMFPRTCCTWFSASVVFLARKQRRGPGHITGFASWIWTWFMRSLPRVRNLRFCQMACPQPGSSSTTRGAPCAPGTSCSCWATATASTWTCSPSCATSGSWRKTKVPQAAGWGSRWRFCRRNPDSRAAMNWALGSCGVGFGGQDLQI